MGEELYKVKARRNIQKDLTGRCVEHACVRQRKRQKHFKWTTTPTWDVLREKMELSLKQPLLDLLLLFTVSGPELGARELGKRSTAEMHPNAYGFDSSLRRLESFPQTRFSDSSKFGRDLKTFSS